MDYTGTINNIAVFESKDVSMGVESFDGGIRQRFVFKNEKSSFEYEIKYNEKEVSRLEFAYIDGKTDGSVLIYDNNGEISGAIGVPWAKDKKGKPVKTYYKIKGTSLIQVIEVNSENEYPIVTDLTTYSSYFHWSKWITRSGVRSLSIKPKLSACGTLGD